MLTNQPFFWPADTSSNQACLCLHGLGGGVYELEDLARALHRQGLTVRGLNYPGHDQPCNRMPHSSWPQWYEAIAQAYGELREYADRISLVSFSTGCALGLHLAAQYPVDRLVLLSPFFQIRHQWYYILRPETYLQILGGLITDVPRRSLPIQDPVQRARAEQIPSFRSFSLPAVRSALDLIEIVKGELPQIYTPTLILQSRQDSVVDPHGANYCYRHLGTAQKQIIWLDRSDHLISLDRDAHRVLQAVTQFLAP